MAKILQTVTFTEKEIQDLLIAKAKEQLKEETGKEPTGSSAFGWTAEADKERGASINFQCNGKR